MARAMPSEELQLLIAGYVLGDLDPDEAATFEQLVATDPAILAEVTQMQRSWELYHGIEAVEPPAQLRSRVLDPAAQPGQLEIATSTPTQLHPSRFAWIKLMGAVAAALVLGLGINNYRLWQTLQTAQTEERSPVAFTYTLQGTKIAKTAAASINVNPDKLEAQLTAENLPPLPPGKVYVLWTVLQKGSPFTTDAKGAILTELFQVDGEGRVTRTIALPKAYRSKELITKLAVSMEDAKAPQKHKGLPVLVTNL